MQTTRTYGTNDAVTERIPTFPRGGAHRAAAPVIAPPMSYAATYAAPPRTYAAPPARPAMRWGWIALGVVAAVLAVAGLASVAAAHRTMTVSGTVTVSGMSGWVAPGAGCQSTAQNGRPVSVYDASGALVGATTLSGYGTARSGSGSSYADSCEFSFSIADVSASADWYRVKVGSGDGQGVGYSRQELADGPVGLTFG